MQVNYNGKQETKAKLQPACTLDDDYTYESNFPDTLSKLKKGDIQHTLFQGNDPPPFYKQDLPPAEYIWKAKGMKQVLFESVLYISGMSENSPADGSNTRMAMKHVLAECLDFKTQKSQLQILIESRN